MQVTVGERGQRSASRTRTYVDSGRSPPRSRSQPWSRRTHPTEAARRLSSALEYSGVTGMGTSDRGAVHRASRRPCMLGPCSIPAPLAEIADRFAVGSEAIPGRARRGSSARSEVDLARTLRSSPGPRGADESAASRGCPSGGVPAPEAARAIDDRSSFDGDAEIRPSDGTSAAEHGRRSGEIGALLAALHRVPFRPAPCTPGTEVGPARWDASRRSSAPRERPSRRPRRLPHELSRWSTDRPGRLDLPSGPLADNSTTPHGGLRDDWDNRGSRIRARAGGRPLRVLRRRPRTRSHAPRGVFPWRPQGGGRPGEFSMAIAQLGHIGEAAARAWLGSETEVDRYNEAWFRVRRPALTRAVIDERSTRSR